MINSVFCHRTPILKRCLGITSLYSDKKQNGWMWRRSSDEQRKSTMREKGQNPRIFRKTNRVHSKICTATRISKRNRSFCKVSARSFSRGIDRSGPQIRWRSRLNTEKIVVFMASLLHSLFVSHVTVITQTASYTVKRPKRKKMFQLKARFESYFLERFFQFYHHLRRWRPRLEFPWIFDD